MFAWITQELLPKLPQNSVIVIDNATSHKRSDIHTAGLPPYSPDLNPIEHK
ncbi:transposase [Beggiatoa leptomitoformis]|uniref:transposase n=1 Tax=Beggiatoa leptomitoformis TaxID=288004 RepID=UPI000AE0696E|nr:transposase [Beggiatoa leptomitoformis]